MTRSIAVGSVVHMHLGGGKGEKKGRSRKSRIWVVRKFC